MQLITSPQNPKYKEALQLHSTRGRKKQNRIIVFGRREIDRAIVSGIEPDQIFVPEGGEVTGIENQPLFQLPEPLFEKAELRQPLRPSNHDRATPLDEVVGSCRDGDATQRAYHSSRGD